MRGLSPRFWRSLYRPDPLASFLLLVGTVDTVIGSASGHWSLFGLGSGAVFAAVALRWWLSPSLPRRSPRRPPRAALPPASSPPPLPPLHHDQQRHSTY
ncbi:MAG: hypothetical protein HC910_06675 [Spirulinaceae cyanobacterium SM2_1_0]|nr:hypothetical protein [Spirulinaceae cyanobacterium SM2_1_0]